MNLLTDRLSPIFRRYLFAAFESTTVAAVYGIVDKIVVGQSQDPDGVAAPAVVLPLWTIIYAFGLMMGIGGGILFGKLKGKTCARIEKANEYFTADRTRHSRLRGPSDVCPPHGKWQER